MKENKGRMVKQYRKLPVVISALKYEGAKSLKALSTWCTLANFGKDGEMYIPTLEGNMRADVGDYIIKGVNGEFYPCKPDVFEKTYEEVK